MVDAESRDAASFVKSRCSLHDLQLLRYLVEHFLHVRELELFVHQSGQPIAPYLCCVKIRDALNVTNERHVWDHRIDRTPD